MMEDFNQTGETRVTPNKDFIGKYNFETSCGH